MLRDVHSNVLFHEMIPYGRGSGRYFSLMMREEMEVFWDGVIWNLICLGAALTIIL
jgi:hypothetical protein